MFRLFYTPLRAGILGCIVGALIGATGAYILCHDQGPNLKPLRESDIVADTGYTFTDPLVGVTSNGYNSSQQYARLQQQVQSYINDQQNKGLFTAAVKFGDIEASQGFTINPNELFDPASLTKVPLAMAYYNLAESDPYILSEKITYTGKPDLDASEQIESAVQLTPGEKYTVEEMIEHMIRNSDNNAEQLLADHLGQVGQLDQLNTLFKDLGIKVSPNDPDYMTVQSYSLFLRVLFNSTYLPRDYSEKLLRLLSESDFSSGIDNGVPNDVLVAHKFGDARIPDSNGNVVGAELQDCGIVYYPNHPYLLCIMTKGSDLGTLKHVIATISMTVFNNVEQQYP